MKRITVFCGSSTGTDDVYKSQAALLGQTLAEKGIELVFGGGKVGLMGVVADGALHKGGKVIGVIPDFFKIRNVVHERLTELIWVDGMHERKKRMNELCDGVIALPGGYGTLEEFFEMLTWGQLGLHNKPVALLNTNGFYDPLIALVQSMVAKGFLKEVNQQLLIVSDNINDLLDKMINYMPPSAGKWIR